jgi:Tfp pilus assembly protein PilF
MQPRNVLALSNAANLLNSAGKHAQAVALCSRALREDPDYVDAMLNMALAYKAMFEMEKAILQVERAMAASPGDPKVLIAQDCLLLCSNLNLIIIA